ncbi:hypothetical protein ACFVVL_31025 [Kitasatospora sp. NPDC058115]|uniref:hypothetical protein n=1 Tax=Kitasatospora sp. NPDC058115 TaxID=3346347 RepID=UPI0036DEF0F2
MPSLLHYEILTDPTSLQVSRPGAPSVGTVYLIVSNPHLADVTWKHIDVLIPVGTGSGHLTDSTTAIIASIPTRSYQPLPGEDAPTFTLHPLGGGRYRAAAPSGREMTMPGQGHLVLQLENIQVSDRAGLAVVSIHEIAHDGDLGAQPSSVPGVYYGTTLGLVKQAPRVPQNLRADLSLVGTGQNVVLRWEGPDSLRYWIRYPDGALEDVAPPVRSAPTPYGPYQHTPGRPLTRGTTYTLVAGTVDAAGQRQEGYLLTTTVHAFVPEFAGGVRAPWIEGTTDRGRVTFTGDGVRVDDRAGSPGTVEAGTADVHHDVRTTTVRGRGADSGWIDFPANGIRVYQGAGDHVWGTVAAGEVDVNDLRTRRARVAERLTVEGSLTVDHVLDTQDGPPRLVVHGRLEAEGNAVVGGDLSVKGRAAAESVTTGSVQGRDDNGGRIEFSRTGVNVYKEGKKRGTVTAGKADLSELVTGGDATVKGTIWGNFLFVKGQSTFEKWAEFRDGIGVTHGNFSLGTNVSYGGVYIRGDISASGQFHGNRT